MASPASSQRHDNARQWRGVRSYLQPGLIMPEPSEEWRWMDRAAFVAYLMGKQQGYTEESAIE